MCLLYIFSLTVKQSLFNGNNNLWLTLMYLCDSSLHNQKMRIVNIKLNRSKEILNSVVLNIAAINQILVLSTYHNLSRDCHFIIVFISQRWLLLVSIVKGDWHSGLGNSCLTIFVDQFLKISCSDMTQIGDSKEKANGIEDVTFTRPGKTKSVWQKHLLLFLVNRNSQVVSKLTLANFYNLEENNLPI